MINILFIFENVSPDEAFIISELEDPLFSRSQGLDKKNRLISVVILKNLPQIERSMKGVEENLYIGYFIGTDILYCDMQGVATDINYAQIVDLAHAQAHTRFEAFLVGLICEKNADPGDNCTDQQSNNRIADD